MITLTSKKQLFPISYNSVYKTHTDAHKIYISYHAFLLYFSKIIYYVIIAEEIYIN